MVTSRLLIMTVGAAHPVRIAGPSISFQSAETDQGGVSLSIGGAAFRASVAMRLFGTRVTLCTVRGGDPAGQEVAEAVQLAGIEEQAFVWLDRTTASETSILDENGTIVASNSDLKIYDLLGKRGLRQRRVRERVADADALLLDTHVPEEAIVHLLDQFAGRPVAAIAVSPASALRLSRSLHRFSALFLTREEAAVLADLPSSTPMEKLAHRLGARGVGRAIVSGGFSQAAIWDNGVFGLQTPPRAAPAPGVVGQRDTMDGLAGVAFQAFVAGHPFVDAVRFGMAAANLRIAQDLSNLKPIEAIIETERRMPPFRPVGRF